MVVVVVAAVGGVESGELSSVVVVAGVVVVVDVVVEGEGAPGGVELTTLVAPAKYVTSRADASPEPKRRTWVRRRARAKRRSRCWGVRAEGVIGVL